MGEQSPKILKRCAESHWSLRQKRNSVILMVCLKFSYFVHQRFVCINFHLERDISWKCFFTLHYWIFWCSLKLCVQSLPHSSPGLLPPILVLP